MLHGMDVISESILRVASLPWQPRNSVYALTVICKATFDLRPEVSPLAKEQEEVWDAADIASDIAPFKRRADVFAVGRAWPAGGGAAFVTAPLIAQIAVGSVRKSIEARPEQGWRLHGLGPLASTSPARLSLLGRHATSWDHRSWAAKPLPEDVDGGYFNVAPTDQQLAELQGDELIALDHLHPRHPRLETSLARVTPWAVVRRVGKSASDVRLRCDTLAIDTERQIAMLVWRGTVILADPAEEGLVVVRAEGASQSSTDEVDATMTVTAPLEWIGTHAATLPFVPSGSSLPSVALTDPERRPSRPIPSRDWNDPTATIALGFARSAEPSSPATPFEQKKREAIGSESSDLSCDDPIDHNDVETRLASMPFDVPRPDFVGPVAESGSREASTPPPIEEPPRLGPLAGLETQAPVIPTPTIVSASEPSAPVGPPEPDPEPSESVELTLEQVAGIAAEIAEGKHERAKVLDIHGLRERTWRAIERRYSDRIQADSANGKHELRAAYDAAYVAKVESFRGPITVAEYARVAVGIERGRANDVLDSLKIQRPALMPLVRLWIRKTAKDMKLGDAAVQALRVARRA